MIQRKNLPILFQCIIQIIGRKINQKIVALVKQRAKLDMIQMEETTPQKEKLHIRPK